MCKAQMIVKLDRLVQSIYKGSQKASTSGKEGLPTKSQAEKKKQDICKDNSSMNDSVEGRVRSST